MDKNMLSKLVTNGSIDFMTIPSTASAEGRSANTAADSHSGFILFKQ